MSSTPPRRRGSRHTAPRDWVERTDSLLLRTRDPSAPHTDSVKVHKGEEPRRCVNSESAAQTNGTFCLSRRPSFSSLSELHFFFSIFLETCREHGCVSAVPRLPVAALASRHRRDTLTTERAVFTSPQVRAVAAPYTCFLVVILHPKLQTFAPRVLRSKSELYHGFLRLLPAAQGRAFSINTSIHQEEPRKHDHKDVRRMRVVCRSLCRVHRRVTNGAISIICCTQSCGGEVPQQSPLR